MTCLSPETRLSEAGISLLETLIALAIVGMVSGAALFGGPAIIDRIAVSHEADAIAGLLTAARQQARRSGDDVTVSIDPADRSLSSINGRVLWSEGMQVTVTSARETSSDHRLGAVIFRAAGSSTGAVIDIGRRSARASLRVDWLTGRVERQP